MKLRIKGDSLRLRVSRSELKRFLQGEAIEETIHFSSEPKAQLTYALESSPDGVSTGVSFAAERVTVMLSQEDANTWSDNSQVGIYTTLDAGGGRSLQLVVEKDFACLDRSDEDNEDTFPNPHADESC
jgi:hypothetical protein